MEWRVDAAMDCWIIETMEWRIDESMVKSWNGRSMKVE